MNRFIIVILIITNSAFAQKQSKSSDNFRLLESYTIENYQTPDSLLFYAANHYEMSHQYDIIYDRIKSQTNKTEIKTDYIFEKRKSVRDLPFFYDLKRIVVKSKYYDKIVFFDIKTTEDQNKLCDKGTCKFYFYMKVYDFKKDKTILKRKYLVRTKKYYYTRANELADLITNELQLKQ